MLVPQDKIGTVTFVSSVMVVKHGTQPSTLVFAQLDLSGTDTHVSIHAMVEEFLTKQADNVFALLVTGMELHVLFVPTLKSGQDQD